MKRTITTVLSLVLGLAGIVGAQENSLYRRADSEAQAKNRRGGIYVQNVSSSGSSTEEYGLNKTNYTPVLKASWFTVEEPSPKDFRVHDLVTIVVNEVSKHSTSADTKTERSYDLQAALNEWFKLEQEALRPKSTNAEAPKANVSFNREFEGKGDVEREDTMSARIQAEIIDIMPNGNLVLEATHRMEMDEEVTMITLTGTCRSKDVGIDNTVISSKVADLRLKKTHEGVARDAVKRGLLSGLLDWLAIF
ncbi:MAG: flagellar basal body L-ring protein FlgH [Sedimentisphaerales bacterium]|nr:flagellar basal body L-ring protein FlgH [Sedimentisphaerales bacterium]